MAGESAVLTCACDNEQIQRSWLLLIRPRQSGRWALGRFCLL